MTEPAAGATGQPVINSFWYGERLSTLERMCMSSFVQQGFAYHLYVYEDPKGVPSGVELRDAEAIVPRSKIFRYSAGEFGVGSFAGFSDLFRYTLIHQIGGWWADTDHACVERFQIDAEEALFLEETKNDRFRVVAGFYKLPAGSDVLAYCLDAIAKKNLNEIVHGEIGPDLITAAVAANHRIPLPPHRFLPVPWWDYQRLLYDEALSTDGWLTVHFWNGMITSAAIDKAGTFPPNSVFERLKRRYL